MINSFKVQLSSNLMLAIVAISASLTAVDFIINRDSSYVMESDLLPQKILINAMVPSTESDSSLVTYTQFDEVQAEVTEVEPLPMQGELKMSVIEQAKQQGLLLKLYIGDDVYQLNALVKRQQMSAVLSVVSTLKGEANRELLTLQLGDTLGPYLVTDINQRRLGLSSGSRKVWLALFVPQSFAVSVGGSSN
jgi:hypothetical protein